MKSAVFILAFLAVAARGFFYMREIGSFLDGLRKRTGIEENDSEGE